MSTLKEAFEKTKPIYLGMLNEDESNQEREKAFRAGARWVIDQLDEAERKEGANLGDHFVELARLRDEVRNGG